MRHPLPPHYLNQQLSLLVVGCGGNGSQILNGLARFDRALRALGHPGLRVTALDPDTVSEANIGRQLFSPTDLGAPKAAVLINRLNLFYGLNWQADHARFDKRYRYNHYNSPHILIGCVDSVAARQSIADHGEDCTYWLDLGNTDKKGQVILGEFKAPRPVKIHKPGKPAKTEPAQPKLPHVLDLNPELTRKGYKEDNRPSCSLAEALERQDLFINQWLATAALQLLWQFIRQGGLDHHGYYINLETGRVTPLPIK